VTLLCAQVSISFERRELNQSQPAAASQSLPQLSLSLHAVGPFFARCQRDQ
jgi:hypothetical protein